MCWSKGIAVGIAKKKSQKDKKTASKVNNRNKKKIDRTAKYSLG